MRFPESPGRLLALVVLVPMILAAVIPGPAGAQTFWGPDASISDGDVSTTQTSLNHQRFAAVDDSNNLYICFFDNRNKIANDNNFEIYFRRFTYNYGSPYITRVTDAYNPSKYPSMAILNWGRHDSATVNDSGRVYMAWQDARLFDVPLAGEPKSYAIFFRTYQSRHGVGFGPEYQVSVYDSSNAANAPSIAVDPSHRAWIVWQRPTNGGAPDLYYAVYDAATRVMGAEMQLTPYDGFYSTSPSIAATRSGEIHVAWVDNRTGGNQIWWKRYSGGAWSADSQLVFSSGTASAPSLTADFRGHLHLVWVDTRAGNNEIFYKEYVPDMGWDAVDTRLTVNSSSQIQPHVDADATSNVYVVWTDLRNGSSNPDIFYKERKNGVWSSDFELVSNLTDGGSNQVQRWPGLTHDALGATYVAWTDERSPASTGRNWEVFYKYGLDNVTAVPVSPPSRATRLLSSYPNPFNPQATVRFEMKRDGAVTLRAFDVQGRLVRTLVDGYLAAGTREVAWDGRDDGGRDLPSGTYYLRLESPGLYEARTVTLVK